MAKVRNKRQERPKASRHLCTSSKLPKSRDATRRSLPRSSTRLTTQGTKRSPRSFVNSSTRPGGRCTCSLPRSEAPTRRCTRSRERPSRCSRTSSSSSRTRKTKKLTLKRSQRFSKSGKVSPRLSRPSETRQANGLTQVAHAFGSFVYWQRDLPSL